MRRAGGIAVGLALVWATAPAASGAVAPAGGYKYVTKAYPDTAGYHSKLQAKCPHGTHVLGGGQYNTAPNQGLRMHHSAPLDAGDPGKVPDDGWRIALESFGTYTVFVQAICGKRPVRYRKDRFTAESQARTGPVPVKCPKGSAPMSGGTSGSPFTFEVASFPGFPNAWNVTVDNAETDDLKLREYAVCAKFGIHPIGSSGTVPPSGETTVTAGCPGNRLIVGGGTSPTGSAVFGVIINSSHPTTIHDGWTVVADNTFTEEYTTASYAVCAKAAN